MTNKKPSLCQPVGQRLLCALFDGILCTTKYAVDIDAAVRIPAEAGMVRSRVLLSPAERSARCRVAAQALHRKYSSRYLTEAARQKFLSRFLDQVDPDRVLPEPERLLRAADA